MNTNGTQETVNLIDSAKAVDPLAHVKVGDADPTPNLGLWCETNSDAGYTCTREPGHPGQHISGDCYYVVGAWPQESAS